MLNTKNSMRSGLNNSGSLALSNASGIFPKPLSAIPSPRSARAIELTVQKAEQLLEQAFNPDEAMASLVCLLGQNLLVAYCRLLLATNDELFLIPKAAYKRLANWQWEPSLTQRFPLGLLPDSLSLARNKFSLVGPHRDLLIMEQLRNYSTKLGLHEPLTGLLLIPLKIEGRLLGVLEFGELSNNLASRLNEEEVQAIIQLTPRLATPLAALLRHH